MKIADFGLAKSMHERRTGQNPEMKQTMCGTPMYMAPEIVKRQGYTAAVDLWSAGVILFTLLTGTMPFHNKNQQLLFKQITDGKFNMASLGCSWLCFALRAQESRPGWLRQALRRSGRSALERGAALRSLRETLQDVTEPLCLVARPGSRRTGSAGRRFRSRARRLCRRC